MTSGLNRALNFRSRGAIRTHRIQSYDAWHGVGGGRLAGFLDFHDFAPFVVPALGAGAMRHLLFVAVWTLRQRVFGQRIVRPPRRGAFLGVSPFRIRHEQFLTWVPRPSSAWAGIFRPDRLYRESWCFRGYLCDAGRLNDPPSASMLELLANVFQR